MLPDSTLTVATRARRESVTIGGRESLVHKPHIDAARLDAAAHGAAPSLTLKQQIQLLFRSRVYVWTVLGMSALFFVVTGIQFWVTPYLVIELKADVGLTGACFIFASATGPTAGVLFGGWAVDKAGGYQGRAQAAKALQICLSFVTLAVTCCVLAIFATSIYVLMPLIWLTLFGGGTFFVLNCFSSPLRSCDAPVFLSSHVRHVSFGVSGAVAP